MTKINKLITHNGSFHADDVFACAVLCLLVEKKGEECEIIRTRDEEIIQSSDYVFDVGGIYDAEQNRFDHHQIGGVGSRGNGIEYSSFGLVWKKFGEELCGSQKVADTIDQKLVSSVDAHDNGINLYKNNFENVFSYSVNDVLSIFSGTALEKDEKDEQFLQALEWAKKILEREIKKNNDQIEITKIIQNYYKNSQDKRVVVIDKPKVSRHEIYDALQNFPEPLFIVYGDKEDWGVVAMRKEINSFKNRKDFPESWAGLRDQELQKVTGVSDAIFCHRNVFLAVAKTKEGAIKLAELALLG
ncbi:MAG: MYG1 family protein [Candidatus Pacebacteria bacterium]|nr:MYG1 family protein [Candidatus Paceibacterota bacterium]